MHTVFPLANRVEHIKSPLLKFKEPQRLRGGSPRLPPLPSLSKHFQISALLIRLNRLPSFQMNATSFSATLPSEVNMGPDYTDAEIQELMKLDPREAFPHYFEGEDGQEVLNIGAMDSQRLEAIKVDMDADWMNECEG